MELRAFLIHDTKFERYVGHSLTSQMNYFTMLSMLYSFRVNTMHAITLPNFPGMILDRKGLDVPEQHRLMHRGYSLGFLGLLGGLGLK